MNVESGLVLVIDDVEGNRVLARAYLERIGWRVDEVAGGREAVEYLKHRVPQAMLIDIVMPHMSGDQLAAYVRQQSALAGVRLVGYTAQCTSEDIRRFKAAGFDEVLIKPVLMAKMSQALPDPRPAASPDPLPNS